MLDPKTPDTGHKFTTVGVSRVNLEGFTRHERYEKKGTMKRETDLPGRVGSRGNRR